jgi:hypothetical protein
MLSGAEIALLPVLGSGGPLAVEGLEAVKIAKMHRKLRPDLKFAVYDRYAEGFPGAFDTSKVDEFYKMIFEGEVLAVKGMDSVWEHIGRPYILVYSLVGGAGIRGAGIRDEDQRVLKSLSVKGELWSRSEREVVWRSVCKGVSDNGRADDARLILQGVRRLAEAVPAAVPNYGQESW